MSSAIMISSESVLVTGGLGYIGCILTRKLLNKGYSVTVLDNAGLDKKNLEQLTKNSNLKIITGDIRDTSVIERSLENAGSIIHLAAISDAISGNKEPELAYEINCKASEQLITSSKNAGIKRFILASTIGVYGNNYNQPLTEDLEVNPADEYSKTKAECEVITSGNNSESFTTVIVRCAIICGWSPKMKFEFIVNALTMKALKEGKISIFGGDQQRPQIHIDDITDYFIAFLEKPSSIIGGEIFNAGGENPTILEIGKDVQKILGEKIELEILPARKNENTFVLNSEKIAKVVELSPKKTVLDAINDLVVNCGKNITP